MFQALRGLFGRSAPPSERSTGRAHVHSARRPALLYAVGDVHGCIDELKQLEQQIVSDASGTEGEKWIVMLGDYIDRGPDSAQVVRHLMDSPPPGFRRISLAGNHEQMLLDFLTQPRRNQGWLQFGGLDTARSYGLDAVASASPAAIAKALERLIPEAHRTWLRELPVALAVPGYIFVHAGVRSGIPLEQQSDEDLLWIRDAFLDSQTPNPMTVVHGHTPAAAPTLAAGRIGIDTGAYATGCLTALRIDEHGATSFLSTRAHGSIETHHQA